MNGGTVAAGPLSLADTVRLYDHAQKAVDAIGTARLLLAHGEPFGPNNETPDELLSNAQELTGRAQTLLYRAVGPSSGSPVALSLSTLAGLDTPDTRELLALLDAAQRVAEKIDAARGHVLPADLPLMPGESRGTDLSETISGIALRVRREVHGGGVGLGE